MAWAEAITLPPQRTVPDEVYAQDHIKYPKQELATLAMAVVEITSWNG
ncbi:hypothetical protein [Dickeya dadantii]|nr:hypothetical protein [Dickeya dadantii]